MINTENSPTQAYEFNTVEEAIVEIQEGKVVIVVDDEDRENEGDFICAAEKVTPEIINFMSKEGRGLICSPITAQRASELSLNHMVAENTDLHGTAFTVSIDYKKKGCSTGISAYDRSTGIRALVDEETRPNDFARPGHIFPLIAQEGGVLRRTGHTEAAVDLAQLAGLKPAGVLIEILNDDGSMARVPQLMDLAKKHDLKIITIKDLVSYRMANERLVKQELQVNVNTAFGNFDMIAFKEKNSNLTHLVIKKGSWEPDENVLVRVTSGSNTGDIIGAVVDGRAEQMRETLKLIDKEGKGVLLYIRRPEEENELLNSLRRLKENTYDQRDEDNNTAKTLAHKNLGIGAQILHDLGVRKIKLITNRPRKRTALLGYDLEIVENISL